MLKKLTAIALFLVLQGGLYSTYLVGTPKHSCCKSGQCTSAGLSCCKPTGPRETPAPSAPLSEIYKVSAVEGIVTIQLPDRPFSARPFGEIFLKGSSPPQLFVLKSSFLI